MKHISLLVAASLVALSGTAHAAGIPVIDPGNIAQSVKIYQQGIQQLQQAKQQFDQVTNLSTSLGAAGKGIAGAILKDAGLDFGDSSLTGPMGQYKLVSPGILDALAQSQAGQGMSSSLGNDAKTSINSGRQFAIEAFFKNGNATADQVATRKGVRAAALRDSATTGYALAVYSKNDLAKTQETMKALSDNVQNATDLRGDVAANTAVQLATLRQVSVTNQLLSQLLEVSATTAINLDDVGIGSAPSTPAPPAP